MNVKHRRSEASKKAWRSRKKMRGAQSHVDAVAKPTTRSDRIKALLDAGKSPQEVATIEGCSDAYVRVVRRRASQTFAETASFKWREKNMDRYRAKQKEWWQRRREREASA